MRDGKNGYAPSSGIKEALDAIRGEAARKGITTVQDVFVTSGVSETVDICLAALLNPGDNLLTPCPDYPLYSAVLAKLGVGLNTYYLNEEDGWQPDLDDIKKKITPRTRGIVLINPNNPTGSVCTRAMLEQIAELARQHNLVIFADEIYDKLIIDDDAAHRHGGGCARCSRHHVRRPVEELSCPGMAHRMGHCQRRRRGDQAVPRRRQQVAARAPVRQSSGTVRDQGGARRSAGSPARSETQAAHPPRSHHAVVQRHSARKLRRAAWRLLRLSVASTFPRATTSSSRN